MRYIRFLKTPRIAYEKNSSNTHVICLITITSDLGDSFLPHDVKLSAELIHAHGNKDEVGGEETVILRKSIKWISGMRSLPVTLPLGRSHSAWPLRVRVGAAPKLTHDDLAELVDERGWRGVVSAWSGLINPTEGVREAEKLVQRRFHVGEELPIEIYEETGESIARHLWDAGITLACHIKQLLTDKSHDLFQFKDGFKRFQVVELGTGCGIVGLTLARTMPNADIVLTDLSEAREIVGRNIALTTSSLRCSVEFKELDWEADLPEPLASNSTACPHCMQIDLIVAADCTYNADSSPALVNTLQKIARASPSAVVLIAMKKRHSSEDVFFDLMSRADFENTRTFTFTLPGDEKAGEETVETYMYRFEGEAGMKVKRSKECASETKDQRQE